MIKEDYFNITKKDRLNYSNNKKRSEFFMPGQTARRLKDLEYGELLHLIENLDDNNKKNGERVYGMWDNHWRLIFQLELENRFEYQRLKKLEMV